MKKYILCLIIIIVTFLTVGCQTPNPEKPVEPPIELLKTNVPA